MVKGVVGNGRRAGIRREVIRDSGLAAKGMRSKLPMGQLQGQFSYRKAEATSRRPNNDHINRGVIACVVAKTSGSTFLLRIGGYNYGIKKYLSHSHRSGRSLDLSLIHI